MADQDGDYSPFDEVNDLLVLPDPDPATKGTSTTGKFEVFRLYSDNNELLYISRSAQLHKLKNKDWWTKVTTISINRHDSPGAAEDDKLMGINNEGPKWNVMNAGF